MFSSEVNGLVTAMLYIVYIVFSENWVGSVRVNAHSPLVTVAMRFEWAAAWAAQRPQRRRVNNCHRGITILHIFINVTDPLSPTWLAEVHSWCPLPLEEGC